MTLVAVVLRASAEILPAVRGAEQGWSSSLEKLAEEIARSG